MWWLAWVLLRVKHSESELGANPRIFGTAELTRLEVCETPLNPQILYAAQIARTRKAHGQSMSIIMGHYWPTLRDKGQVK